VSAPAAAIAGTWVTEAPVRAGFAARNFGFATVRGTIAILSGRLEIDAGGRPVRLSGTLDPATIDTANPRRDRDLRGPRFLDVEHHPSMELSAAGFEPVDTGGWRARAVLRVAGHEAPLWIDGTITAGPPGRLHVTCISRLYLPDAGLRPPRVLVGHTVELSVDADLTLAEPS
jgi:polyisoprenoid-binding protein YceI